jgi:hypothetical protein
MLIEKRTDLTCFICDMRCVKNKLKKDVGYGMIVKVKNDFFL